MGILRQISAVNSQLPITNGVKMIRERTVKLGKGPYYRVLLYDHTCVVFRDFVSSLEVTFIRKEKKFDRYKIKNRELIQKILGKDVNPSFSSVRVYTTLHLCSCNECIGRKRCRKSGIKV